MEEIIQQFPEVGSDILNHLDDCGLVTFKKVNGIWRNFIDNEKMIWIRMIERFVCKRYTFQEDWKKAVLNTSVHMIRELSIATYRFYDLRKKFKHQIFSPLYIAADQGNLKLCNYLIGRSIDVNWKELFCDHSLHHM